MVCTYCDRCYGETTDRPSGHVLGIPDADADGNGDVQERVDLCAACYEELVEWLKPKHARAAGSKSPRTQTAAGSARSAARPPD